VTYRTLALGVVLAVACASSASTREEQQMSETRKGQMKETRRGDVKAPGNLPTTSELAASARDARAQLEQARAAGDWQTVVVSLDRIDTARFSQAEVDGPLIDDPVEPEPQPEYTWADLVKDLDGEIKTLQDLRNQAEERSARFGP